MHRRFMSRALPALASASLTLLTLLVIAPAPATGQGCLPIEQRLQEQWRWRAMSEPGHEPTFVSVRPWSEGGLVAVDEQGLVKFDGYEWERRPGWWQVTWQALRDVVDEPDGVVVVAANAVMSIDSAGRKLSLWQSPNPSQLTNACRLEDGRVVIGVKHSVRAVSVQGVDSLFSSPETSRLLAGLGSDASGNLLCATERGVFRRDGDDWSALPVDRLPSHTMDGMMFSLKWPGGLMFLPRQLDEESPGYV